MIRVKETTPGKEAMSGLRVALSKLYVPSTYIENGYTQVHSQRPNGTIPRLTSTGTLEEPSLRIRNRRGTHFLFAERGFACSLKQLEDGGYAALASFTLFGVDGSPYGPEGYSLQAVNSLDVDDPSDTHAKDLRRQVRAVGPELDVSGRVSYGQSDQSGIELATQMTAEVSALSRLGLIARLGEALQR